MIHISKPLTAVAGKRRKVTSACNGDQLTNVQVLYIFLPRDVITKRGVLTVVSVCPVHHLSVTSVSNRIKLAFSPRGNPSFSFVPNVVAKSRQGHLRTECQAKIGI